jgi:hypothetical protein
MSALDADELRERLDRIERRLTETQAMAGRTYEAAANWPAGLAEVRGVGRLRRRVGG